MSFTDIKGQEQAIRLIRDCILEKRIAGSYLFIGPEGIGKKNTAINFAKAINCDNHEVQACERCVSCLKIDKGDHPDIHFIESVNAAIRIEAVRNLQKEINLKPYQANYKVFIIDNAHRLTAEASNALLKILEEPLGKSLIILISSKVSLLFKTIISRCQIIKFFPLPRKQLQAILNKDYLLQPEVSHFLAYFSEGRISKAISLKDSDILSQRNQVIDDFLCSHEQKPLNIDFTDRELIRNNINILSAWFRDIYYLKLGLPLQELINSDRNNELLVQEKKYSYFELNEIMDSLSNSILYLEKNANARCLLSNLRAKICKI